MVIYQLMFHFPGFSTVFFVETRLSSIFDVRHALALISYSFHISLSYLVEILCYSRYWCTMFNGALAMLYHFCFILYLLDAGRIEDGVDTMRSHLAHSRFRMIQLSAAAFSHPKKYVDHPIPF